MIANAPSGYIGSVSPANPLNPPESTPSSNTPSSQSQYITQSSTEPSNQYTLATREINRLTSQLRAGNVTPDAAIALSNRINQLNAYRQSLVSSGGSTVTITREVPNPNYQGIIISTPKPEVKPVTASDVMNIGLPLAQPNVQSMISPVPSQQISAPTTPKVINYTGQEYSGIINVLQNQQMINKYNPQAQTLTINNAPVNVEQVRQGNVLEVQRLESLYPKGGPLSASAEIFSIAGTSIGYGLLQTPEQAFSAVQSLSNPKSIYLGVSNFVNNPSEVYKGMSEYVQKYPGEFAGSFIGLSALSEVPNTALGTKVLSRLGDVHVIPNEAYMLEAPKVAGTAIEGEFTVMGEGAAAAKAGSQDLVFVRDVPSPFSRQYTSGDFRLDLTNYQPTIKGLGDITTTEGKVYIPTTDIYGGTKFVPEPGFLFKKGVKLSFEPVENPLLNYGQTSLAQTNFNEVKFVDIMQPVDREISPYIKGMVVNTPTQTIPGDNFVMYQEYSRFLPIRFGHVIIDNAELGSEGIGRYIVRDQGLPNYPVPTNTLSYTQLTLDAYNYEGQKLLTYEPSLSKFGYIDLSPIDTNVKYLAGQREIAVKNALIEAQSSMNARIVAEQLIPYSPLLTSEVINLRTATPSVRPRVEYINSVYANDKVMGEKFSIGAFDNEIGARPSTGVSNTIFGKRANFVEVQPNFGVDVSQGSNIRIGLANIHGGLNKGMSGLSFNYGQGVYPNVETNIKRGLDIAPIEGTQGLTDLTQSTSPSIIQLQQQGQVQQQVQVQQQAQASLSENVSPNSSQPKESPLDIPYAPSEDKRFPKFKVPIKRKSGKEFKVEVRRRGKFEVIGETTDIVKATQLLVKDLKATAAASGKILSEDNQPVIIQPPQGFRHGKHDVSLIVQPRSQRISSFGEKQEITYKGIAASRNKSFNTSTHKNILQSNIRRGFF